MRRRVNANLFLSTTIVALVNFDALFGQRQEYDFESGIIEYKMTGAQTGTKVLYFSDFGMNEAQHIDGYSTVPGVKTKIKESNIERGKISYVIDMIAKRAYKFINPMYEEDKKYKLDLLSDEDYRKATGAKKAGVGFVLDKKCTIWETTGQGVHMVDWVWKGLVMKNEMTMGGQKSSLIAVKLDLNTKVGPERFLPPQSVRIDSVDASKIYKF